MASISALNISGTKYDIFAQSALWAKSGTNFSANSINVNGDLTANTLNSNELVVNGAARILGTLYASNIEGKITSAISADNADKLDGLEASVFASASDVSTLKGYFNNGSAKSADKATSATTSNVARTLTATISANYSSLSAGSAKLAGTATNANKVQWATAQAQDKERPFGISWNNDTIIGGSTAYDGVAFSTTLTYNTTKSRMKAPNVSSTTMSSNNYTIENKARMQYNSTDDCIDFLFV